MRVLRRPRILLLIALIVAVASCGWQAVLILRFRSPDPSISARVGQSVTVGGVSYRVDEFTIADSFPAADADSDPLTAPVGAKVVKVVFTEEVLDPGRDLTTIFCDLSVNTPDGRRWTSADQGYRLFDREAPTCSGTSDDPVALRKPFPVGVAFLIPAAAADQLSFRLRLSTERETVEFAR